MDNHQVPEPRTYERPEINVVGELVEDTLGNLDGQFTDALFPQHTPKPDLRFS